MKVKSYFRIYYQKCTENTIKSFKLYFLFIKKSKTQLIKKYTEKAVLKVL